MKGERELPDQFFRENFTSFLSKAFNTIASGETLQMNYHVHALAWHLQQCATGEMTRLLITLPPRYLKSIAASVAFPAWLLGRDPTKNVICASYSADLAGKHALDCRAVMSSDWFLRAFPRARLSPEKNTELNFMTTERGSRYATSVGGTLTGRGANFIIIDDPLKPDEAMSDVKRIAVNEWFDRTVFSRLDDKARDVIVLVMQRLHVEDLAAHVLAKRGWTHLDLPAIAETEQRIPIGPDRIHRSSPRSAG